MSGSGIPGSASAFGGGSAGYAHANGGSPPLAQSLSLTAVPRDAADAQMDQIRDLLFGDLRRDMEQRFRETEQRHRDIEARLAALEARLAAARTEDDAKRRAMMDEIARGVAALGDHVRQAVKP